MTGRTHDVAAFCALTYVVAATPLFHMSLATGFVAFTANLIGGLAPDIDQPTADLWHKLPGGTFYSRIFTPLLGGHRFISHSIVGIVLFGALSWGILFLMSKSLLTNMTIVWWAFIVGYLSHLVMDTYSRKKAYHGFFPFLLNLVSHHFLFCELKPEDF